MKPVKDASDALALAKERPPNVVAWVPGELKGGGWIVYPPTEPPPGKYDPEFLVIGGPSLPIPLSEEGCEVLASIYTRKAIELQTLKMPWACPRKP